MSVLQRAVERHRAQDLEEARRLYRQVLDQDPQDFDAQHLLGVVEQRLGDPATAIRHFHAALTLQPDAPNVMFNYSTALVKQERWVDLYTWTAHALQIQPDFDYALTNLRLAVETLLYDETTAVPAHLMPADDTVVFYLNKAGLGDNLLYSTLPELFHRAGKKFYVSQASFCRNPEIYDLVWGRNPYVLGRSKFFPNAGIGALLDGRFSAHSHILNWLTRAEVLHGFEAGNDLPQLHYQPRRHAELAGKVLVDLASKTVTYTPELMADYLEFTLSRFHYDRDDVVFIRFKSSEIGEDNLTDAGGRTYTVQSIFDYCDAISSARALITVHSGANSMAAAIKRDNPSPAIHCAVDANHFNQKCYIWKNIDYSIV